MSKTLKVIVSGGGTGGHLYPAISVAQQIKSIEPNADKILDELRASRGFLRLTDNSHPEDIKTVLKMSKKTFKKAIGALYKEKLIEIKEDGIYLVKE